MQSHTDDDIYATDAFSRRDKKLVQDKCRNILEPFHRNVLRTHHHIKHLETNAEQKAGKIKKTVGELLPTRKGKNWPRMNEQVHYIRQEHFPAQEIIVPVGGYCYGTNVRDGFCENKLKEVEVSAVAGARPTPHLELCQD